MRFKTTPLDPESAELDEFIACQIASFNTPYQSIYRFFYPIFGGESQTEKQDAFRSLVELQRRWARDDPDTVFLQVRDAEDGDKLVGGLVMKIHRRNPYAREQERQSEKDEDEAAVWYPEGSRREYITRCIGIFSQPHREFMQRPHVYLFIGFVHPSYREQGIADIILTTVCEQADVLGLEAWLESVIAMGVPIYMRHGFIPHEKQSVRPSTANPDAEWEDMERRMQPLRFWPMWRPPKGRVLEASPPWREGRARCSRL